MCDEILRYMDWELNSALFGFVAIFLDDTFYVVTQLYALHDFVNRVLALTTIDCYLPNYVCSLLIFEKTLLGFVCVLATNADARIFVIASTTLVRLVVVGT